MGSTNYLKFVKDPDCANLTEDQVKHLTEILEQSHPLSSITSVSQLLKGEQVTWDSMFNSFGERTLVVLFRGFKLYGALYAWEDRYYSDTSPPVEPTDADCWLVHPTRSPTEKQEAYREAQETKRMRYLWDRYVATCVAAEVPAFPYRWSLIAYLSIGKQEALTEEQKNHTEKHFDHFRRQDAIAVAVSSTSNPT